MAILLPLFSISPIVKASSVDTTQRLPYTPHRTTPKKPQTPDSLSAISTISLSPSTSRSNISVSDLLKREIPKSTEVKPDGTYMGYDVWLPRAHKVEKPRSVFNAASLAYIGDCIFELYARRHFLFPPLSIEEYNDRVMAVVRCEAQDAMLQKLLNDNILSEEERGVLRWGKNVGSGKTKTKKRAGVAVYNRASSLETLVGYLYLTNVQRLEEIMLKLGFHIGDSSLPIVERIDAHAVIYTRAGSGSTDTSLLKKKPSRSQSLESRLLFTYAIDDITFQGSGFLILSFPKLLKVTDFAPKTGILRYNKVMPEEEMKFMKLYVDKEDEHFQ